MDRQDTTRRGERFHLGWKGAAAERIAGHMPDLSGEAQHVAEADCPRCLKARALCVCDSVETIENRLSLLILQHPQEQDRALGTARLAVQHFRDAVLRIGLSWPSLSKALGRAVADPSRWAILYLGSAKVRDLDTDAEIVALTRKGEVAERQRAIFDALEGVILLDGTWSQAKALWWRNPWMLKCQRVILGPKRPSRYGTLRREPRSDGLSTIEAAAMLIARLEKRPDIEETLNASFERMLARYREVQATSPELAPKPNPRPRPHSRRDFRRRKRA
jgi:DTW domain-containing protein YfiP